MAPNAGSPRFEVKVTLKVLDELQAFLQPVDRWMAKDESRMHVMVEVEAGWICFVVEDESSTP